MERPRGRPKKYVENDALLAAGQVFWSKGFSATSLDDLSVAMEMNRPSIYRAFGDKETIYRKALKRFCEDLERAFDGTMNRHADIKKALTQFYQTALGVYISGSEQKGCMVMSTAVTAATNHPEIQADLLGVIRSLDEKFTIRFEQARNKGQLNSSFDITGRAALAQGLLHSLSLRARAGETPRLLKIFIKSGVEAIIA